MPYYNAGDYYGRGDYYQAGGIFGSLFRGITHVVGGAIKGFIGGGLPGAIVGAGAGAVSGTRANIAADRAAIIAAPSVPMIAPPVGVGVMAPGGGFPPGVITTSPLGTPVSPAAIAMQLGHLGVMRHLHPNKSTYVTRGGGTSHWPQQLIVHPKGTEQVRSRRMNVGNARALRRAIRRASGFAKLARRVLVTTHRFKKHRRRK